MHGVGDHDCGGDDPAMMAELDLLRPPTGTGTAPSNGRYVNASTCSPNARQRWRGSKALAKYDDPGASSDQQLDLAHAPRPIGCGAGPRRRCDLAEPSTNLGARLSLHQLVCH